MTAVPTARVEFHPPVETRGHSLSRTSLVEFIARAQGEREHLIPHKDTVGVNSCIAYGMAARLSPTQFALAEISISIVRASASARAIV